MPEQTPVSLSIVLVVLEFEKGQSKQRENDQSMKGTFVDRHQLGHPDGLCAQDTFNFFNTGRGHLLDVD